MARTVSNKINVPSARVGAGSYRATFIIALVILPLTLLLLENASAFNTRLAFSTSSEVASSKIYINDLLESFSGADDLKQKTMEIVVASAPAPGKVTIIKRPQIVKALARNELTAENAELQIPDEIKVTRKASVFGKAEIENIIKAELLKRNVISENGASFAIEDFQNDVILPSGGNITTIVRMPNSIKSNSKFWVSFYIDGKLKNKIWASGSVEKFLEILAVNKNLSVNEKITDNDLIYIRKNTLDLSDNYVTDKSAVIGKVALKNISQGSILKRDCVAAPALVKAGDMVSILAQKANLTISASGKILSATGAVGDIVTVLNVDSKEKITAVVLNEKTVKVEVE